MLFFKNNVNKFKENELINDDNIVSMADGKQIDISSVSDPVFSNQLLGESIAFKYQGDKVMICAPASGTLNVLFPTGHAFGILMKNGVELLVHIGVNTVESQGEGFKIINVKQGQKIRSGDPVVEVDYKKLSKKYDMSTMLIIVNKNNKDIQFSKFINVVRGQNLLK